MSEQTWRQGIIDELDEAARGEHGFGGHTAEIYVYRALPEYVPGTGMSEDMAVKANKRLMHLMADYEESTGNTVRVECYNPPRGIEQLSAGPWMVHSGNRHRWHIEVQLPDEQRAKQELYEWALGFVRRYGHVFDELADK